jgi:hypothetical protein
VTLIYTTSDGAFASHALSKLKAADIESFVSGDTDFGPRYRGERTFCVHVVSDADDARANEILIELGAVQDQPIRLPTGRWVHVVLFAVGVAVAVVVILLVVK